MTQFLPPNLLALFAPRDPIPYLPPVGKLPHEKKNRGYIGAADFVKYFEKVEDTPPPRKIETREERLERRRRERAEQIAYKLEQEIAVWDPTSLTNATADPFKTLFIARINYDTSESKLRREFEIYGPIRKIVLVHNTVNGKPRGYAFIEYEHERDMHAAYKHADGKKIDGKRVLVDVERARTVRGWLPRRLGGGLGGTRRGGPDVNLKHSGREDNDRGGGGGGERYDGAREQSEVRDRRRAPTVEKDRERPDRYERPERPERYDRSDRIERPERPERPERRRSRSPRLDRERRRRSRTRSRERKRRDIRDEVEPVEERYERDRKRRRSRSYDRGERKRDRRDRGDRDRERDRNRDKDRKDNVFDKEEKVRIKTEPVDDYPSYSSHQQAVAPPAPGNFPDSSYQGYPEYPIKKEEERRYGPSDGYQQNENNYETRAPPPLPAQYND